MNISLKAQAVLLLTVRFAKLNKGDPHPLTPTEWGRLAQWMHTRGISPEALLTDSPERALDGWTDRSITLDRIHYLLGRSVAMGLALEKWQRAGLWVLTRSDADYPDRLKAHLKAVSPPVLFGCGNHRLLNQGGIAVVGSRNPSEDDLAFTTRLGGAVASQGLSVVSGGARGVDETAMLGALEREGTVVGVLADSLLRAATSAKYRKGLMSRNLVLVSPFNPEAGFDVGNAMARNKYIYCLSHAAIVVASTPGKGGTWNGAVEDLKLGWVPLWVKPHPGAGSGNAELVRRGGRWLPEGTFSFFSLFGTGAATSTPLLAEGSPAQVLSAEKRTERPETQEAAFTEGASIPAPQANAGRGTVVTGAAVQRTEAGESMTFYEFFLQRLQVLTRNTPATVDELVGHLDVGKAQVSDWLKRAAGEGCARKFTKPVRYQWKEPQSKQGTIF